MRTLIEAAKRVATADELEMVRAGATYDIRSAVTSKKRRGWGGPRC